MGFFIGFSFRFHMRTENSIFSFISLSDRECCISCIAGDILMNNLTKHGAIFIILFDSKRKWALIRAKVHSANISTVIQREMIVSTRKSNIHRVQKKWKKRNNDRKKNVRRSLYSYDSISEPLNCKFTFLSSPFLTFACNSIYFFLAC